MTASRLTLSEAPAPSLLTQDMIAFEDDFMLIVDKPAGMLVHPTVNERGTTLYDYVASYYAAKGIVAAIHPVSRLDRNTSGLVIFAKEPIIQFWLVNGTYTRNIWPL